MQKKHSSPSEKKQATEKSTKSTTMLLKELATIPAVNICHIFICRLIIRSTYNNGRCQWIWVKSSSDKSAQFSGANVNKVNDYRSLLCDDEYCHSSCETSQWETHHKQYDVSDNMDICRITQVLYSLMALVVNTEIGLQ